MESNSYEIEIPSEIYLKCESHIQDTEFDTVEEYILFVLEIIISEADINVSSDYNKLDRVNKRLESLGYL